VDIKEYMRNKKPTSLQKIDTVLSKNTFFFFNNIFEERYEGHINSIKQTLLLLKNEIDNFGLKKDVFTKLLLEKENGLSALLALTGLSNEMFKRLITIIRISDNGEINRLVNKDRWIEDYKDNSFTEWSDERIKKLIVNNQYFREGVVNVFFEGSSTQFLSEVIPLFELKKLDIAKLKFSITEMVDSLVRYKEKGSYSGKKGNNPELLIEELLDANDISFQKGDLKELVVNSPDEKRTMDFIIPSKDNPTVIVESSFLSTTSSGQGDKSKTELSINQLIKKHYPKALFYGFVDGIGWYVRRGDLKRMVTAYDDVFTYHKDELDRFLCILLKLKLQNV